VRLSRFQCQLQAATASAPSPLRDPAQRGCDAAVAGKPNRPPARGVGQFRLADWASHPGAVKDGIVHELFSGVVQRMCWPCRVRNSRTFHRRPSDSTGGTSGPRTTTCRYRSLLACPARSRPSVCSSSTQGHKGAVNTVLLPISQLRPEQVWSSPSHHTSTGLGPTSVRASVPRLRVYVPPGYWSRHAKALRKLPMGEVMRIGLDQDARRLHWPVG
jgi:hypothetical protein